MDKFDPTKGGIYVPFIADHIAGINSLNNKINVAFADLNIDGLIAFDYDGSFLLDQLDITKSFHGSKIIIKNLGVKGEALDDSDAPATLSAEAIWDLQNQLLPGELSTALEPYPLDEKLNFVFVTPFVTGGTLLQAWKRSMTELMKAYTNLTLHVVLLQQTVQTDDVVDPAVWMSSEAPNFKGHLAEGRVHVYSDKVRYLLGHGVDYQVNPNHSNARRPIMVFDKINEEIEAFSLTASEDTTCRDVVLKLIAGEFRGKLGNLH
jgi:hypothetical protein